MHDADAATRLVLLMIATVVLQARHSRRWSQRRLASEARVSQSVIARLERQAIPDMPIATAVQILAALGIPFDLHLRPPLVLVAARDAAHARCIAYVIGRLERAGFVVASEVEISGPGWTGSIDILAYHPLAHVLLVIEVKTQLLDLGASDRQLARYEAAAWTTAQRLGWRPRAATGVLLLLWTTENDRRVVDDRRWFDRRFTLRSKRLLELLDDPERPPERGARVVAMIDPRSRRARWAIPTPIDGRRTDAPYLDRFAYLEGRRTA